LSDGGATEDDQHEAIEKRLSIASETSNGGEKAAFFECWHRSFTQAGLMHIKHRAYLEMSVASMVMVGITLLWLTHLRILALGSFHSFYAAPSPSNLFEVYGAPGSGERCAALMLEIMLIFLAGERLHGICGLLHTAALSLQQRHRALLFTSDHPPPPLMKRGNKEAAVFVNDAMGRIEECVRCTEFASELSSLRWAVLRAPVLLVFFIDIMLLALAIVAMFLMCVEAGSDSTFPKLHEYMVYLVNTAVLDPMVPLGIALCLTWPLILVLTMAALSNGEVYGLRARLQQDVASALAEIPAEDQVDDVPYVALRLKGEALQNHMICWPGERELSLCEPALLVIAAALACGLAVATGNAQPGVVSSMSQTLM